MKKIYYGAAYYPELWNMDTIEQDITLMRDVGINVVRMGEFAWSKMEPREGKIDLSFFVEIIKKLKDNDIDTIFCTPTPTPPIWMSHNHPERLHVNKDGIRLIHGARQHICTNNAYVRERVKIIVEAICKAIAPLDSVIAWQIDNELKCHVTECYCEHCRLLWHEWLQKKYSTVENMNKLWGTDVWSEAYLEFEQVPQPFKAPFLHNASLSAAYKIFSRETTAEYAAMQAEIIHTYSKAPVTHNSNQYYALDNSLLFSHLDFASFDDYPDCDNYHQMLYNYSLWRNVFDKPFWVMETSPSHNGCLEASWMSKTHRPGYLAVEALAAIAMGAEGFSHWLWRQQRAGCEQIHGSVISSWGKPTIGYEEVKKTKAVFNKVQPIITNTVPVKGEAAVTYSDFGSVFLSIETMETPPYLQLMRNMYDTIYSSGVRAEFIMEHVDPAAYKLLITPYKPALRDEYIEKALRFVKNGGTWLVGPLTGYRTCEFTVHVDAGLGCLDELAGVTTEITFPPKGADMLLSAMGMEACAEYYTALFTPNDAQSKGSVIEGIGKGLSFLTERSVGKGKIVLLGAKPAGEFGDAMLQAIIKHYAKEAGISETGFRETCKTTDGTISILRKNAKEEFVFFINMDGKGGKYFAGQGYTDAFTGDKVNAGWNELAAYEFAVVKDEEIIKPQRKKSKESREQ